MNTLKRSAAMFVSLLIALAGGALVASPARAALTYFYAGAYQTFTAPSLPNGISGNITADDVTLVAGDFHTLVEMDVEQGSGANRQIIEVGYTIDPAVNGDSNPHIFVGCWLNGVFGGYNTCSHGGGADNWVDLAANVTYNAGTTLTVDSAYTMRIQYDSADCGAAPNGWWVAVYPVGGAANWIGCFKDTKWTGAGVTFTTGTKLQAFGEVAANVANPCTNMASNPAVLATTSTGRQVGSISIPNLGSGAVNMNSYFITNAAWYNAVLATGSMRTVNLGGGGAC